MTEQDDRQARLDEAVDKIRDAARQLVEAFARLGEAAMKALRAAGELLATWRAAWPVELAARTGRPLPPPHFGPNGWPFRADPPDGGWRGPGSVAFTLRPHAAGPVGPVRRVRTGPTGRGQVP